jgi:hypothetical protein
VQTWLIWNVANKPRATVSGLENKFRECREEGVAERPLNNNFVPDHDLGPDRADAVVPRSAPFMGGPLL